MKVSLQSKNGYYYAVTSYKEGDKYRQKWEALHLKAPDDKKEAEKLLKKLSSKNKDLSVPMLESNKTAKKEWFYDWVLRWVDYKKDFVEMSTWEGYYLYATRHIVPYFKEHKKDIRDISSEDIQQYVINKSNSGRCDNKPGGLSNAAIKKHVLVISEVLNYAVSQKIIPFNPKQKIVYRNINKPVERVFINLEQANDILKLFDGTQLQRLICVVLYYGLRRSEVLGLRWSSVNFKEKTLEINHTVVKNISIEEKDRVKTSSSFHKYQLIPNVEDILLKQIEWQNKQKNIYGNAYIDSGYVFTKEDGRVLRPDYVTRAFERQLKRCGFPKMRFHDLRHSTASILYDLGWNIKDIQLWLRHSSIDITADIYTHISESRKNALAMSLNNSFFIQESPILLTQNFDDKK